MGAVGATKSLEGEAVGCDLLRPRVVEGERKDQMDKRRARQAATERRQSAEALRMVPTLQWAMSGGETGQRVVGWLVAVRMCQQKYRAAA
jgi:hypothetical protein